MWPAQSPAGPSWLCPSELVNGLRLLAALDSGPLRVAPLEGKKTRLCTCRERRLADEFLAFLPEQRSLQGHCSHRQHRGIEDLGELIRKANGLVTNSKMRERRWAGLKCFYISKSQSWQRCRCWAPGSPAPPSFAAPGPVLCLAPSAKSDTASLGFANLQHKQACLQRWVHAHAPNSTWNHLLTQRPTIMRHNPRCEEVVIFFSPLHKELPRCAWEIDIQQQAAGSGRWQINV